MISTCLVYKGSILVCVCIALCQFMLMFSNCMTYNKGTPNGRKYQSEAKRQKKFFEGEVYPMATAELEKQLACVTDRCNLQAAAGSKVRDIKGT